MEQGEATVGLEVENGLKMNENNLDYLTSLNNPKVNRLFLGCNDLGSDAIKKSSMHLGFLKFKFLA